MVDTHETHESDVADEEGRRIWSRAGVWGTLGVIALVLATVVFVLAQRVRTPELTPGQPRPALAPVNT